MSEQGINWGKVITGAAIAVGAVAAAAVFLPATSAIVTTIVANQALAYGTAAVAGGIMAHQIDKAHQRSEEKIEHGRHSMEAESFAMREDIRRMQGLMAARMQAMGYAPAEAQGRG